jgi:hypothetical protein
MPESFSVYQFLPNEDYECVRQHVSLEEAMQAAVHYCSSVGARMGVTSRVIITDGGDHTVFEWKFNEGITFPEALKGLGKPKTPSPAMKTAFDSILPNPFKGEPE